MTINVKVYRVTEMTTMKTHELTIPSAIENALERVGVERIEWSEPDCKFIAVVVDEDGERLT